MSDADIENPGELPDSHPLAGFEGSLDDHAAHVDAITECLDQTDAAHIRSLMLVLTTEEPATDTIPTARADADVESCVWYQLAAHIGHVASSFDADPEQVARHACHVLRDQQSEPEVYPDE